MRLSGGNPVRSSTPPRRGVTVGDNFPQPKPAAKDLRRREQVKLLLEARKQSSSSRAVALHEGRRPLLI